MQLVWTHLKKYKKHLAFALALATINQVFSLLDPQIFRLIIDRYAERAGEFARPEFISGVVVLLLASIGVAFVSRVAKNFQDYFVNAVTQRVGAGLYARGVEHSLALPYSIFEDQRSGELLRKLEKARTDIQTAIASAINGVFFVVVGILFVVSYAVSVHWLVGLMYLLAIPLIGFTIFFISRRIKAAQKKIVLQTAELAGSTTETLRNVELVKALGLEGQEVGRLNRQNEAILALELRKIKLIRALSFVQGTLVNLVRTVLLFLMLWLIRENALTLGQFFSLLFYSFFVFGPLAEFGTVAGQFQEAKASSEALEDILRTEPEPQPEHPKAAGSLREILFREATFSYATSDDDAIRGITATIAAGETVAFVGPSGGGKSTLLKLLLGLYKPAAGDILVNGIPHTELDYRDFRSRIGFVSQETQLFAGTIRENLLFVNMNASDEEMKEALRQAAALPIIERRSADGEQAGEGLDTKIGEGGVKLSGGERQRLAIARALLRKPDLLIFDEATSSLDSLTEKDITATIRAAAKIRPNLMTVLVAHRLSTVQHAHRIYVLEKGAIVESGTHAELLQTPGLYAAMWREQAGGAENNR